MKNTKRWKNAQKMEKHRRSPLTPSKIGCRLQSHFSVKLKPLLGNFVVGELAATGLGRSSPHRHHAGQSEEGPVALSIVMISIAGVVVFGVVVSDCSSVPSVLSSSSPPPSLSSVSPVSLSSLTTGKMWTPTHQQHTCVCVCVWVCVCVFFFFCLCLVCGCCC
jgi:hypothetical protein